MSTTLLFAVAHVVQLVVLWILIEWLYEATNRIRRLECRAPAAKEEEAK